MFLQRPSKTSEPGPGTAKRSEMARQPSATASTDAVAARHLQRQLEAVTANTVRVWVPARILLTLTIVGLCWPHVSHMAAVAYMIAVAANLGALLVIGRAIQLETRRALPPRSLVLASICVQATLAISDSVAVIGLLEFGRGTPTFIATPLIAAVMIYAAWALAYYPPAAATWLLTFTLSASVLLTESSLNDRLLILALLWANAAFAYACVLANMGRFQRTLELEDEAAAQGDALAMLLEDFESDANEWLWETDDRGHLRRVPDRLAALLGVPPEELADRQLTEILPFAAIGDAQTLASALACGEPFRGLVVDVLIAGQPHTMRLSGKPIAAEPPETGWRWRGVGADITDEVGAQRELFHLARFDSLTGLANRHRLLSTLDNWLSGPAPVPCTFMLFDLDDFKMTNDTLGHDAGDELLREVARRLGRHTTGRDLLGRLGGDEFVLLKQGRLDHAAVQVLFDTMHADLAAPYAVHGEQVETGISCGAACAPADTHDGSELLSCADMALYESKRGGGNTLSFYTPALLVASEQRRATVESLRQAIRDNQLFLVYQPVVDPHGQCVTGFEALARWRHPERGVIPPSEFIPLAEESGLIIELGEWVLRTACQQAAALPAAMTISVNVSARQLRAGNIDLLVADVLAATGLSPHRLMIEVTESLLIADRETVRGQLKRLRATGVSVALDDFGTGYSSLYLLRTLPCDRLKIDRAFVLDLGEDPQTDEMALVDSIISMARALGLTSVIEGVETPTQLAFFTALGVDAVQGYVYSPPLPFEEALRYRPEITASDQLVA